MWQHQILLMGDADLVMAEFIGQPRDRIHLIGCRIAWNAADRLE
jgi:hypothetical protein